jgi:hypothetical protein
MRQPLIGRWG